VSAASSSGLKNLRGAGSSPALLEADILRACRSADCPADFPDLLRAFPRKKPAPVELSSCLQTCEAVDQSWTTATDCSYCDVAAFTARVGEADAYLSK